MYHNSISGKENPLDRSNKNVGEKVCLPLTRNYHNDTQRTLTADNFFTSFDLVTTLYSLKFNYVDTMKKNKAVIGLLSTQKTRAAHSSVYGFLNEKTLVSYVPKPNKAVILISSKHHTDSIVESSDSKPEIILFYNATKGSVDAFDQQLEKIHL